MINGFPKSTSTRPANPQQIAVVPKADVDAQVSRTLAMLSQVYGTLMEHDAHLRAMTGQIALGAAALANAFIAGQLDRKAFASDDDAKKIQSIQQALDTLAVYTRGAIADVIETKDKSDVGV